MKTKKLNLVDVLIIIVIAVIVTGVFFRAEIRSLFFSDESSSFLMDVQITFLENSRASAIKDGLAVYDSDGKELGTITAVSKTPSSDTVTIDGVDREVLSTRCSDVTVTIMLRGYIADGVYYTKSGIKLLLNDNITLETDALSLSCRILDVRKVAVSES